MMQVVAAALSVQDSRSLLRRLIEIFSLLALAVFLFRESAFAQQPPAANLPVNDIQPLSAPAGAEASQPTPKSAPKFVAMPGFMETYEYETRGRRDPFAEPFVDKPLPPGQLHGPALPLQKYKLNDLKLTGVIWNVKHPKAMIQDPDGKIYIVGPNAKLGQNNGYIAVIREGEIVIVETMEENGRLLSSTKLVKLYNSTVR